ncbi:unnamed protein product [Prunus armeniaca]|uniref:RNase H type-1 domain-containing protein n=1 Tax=Prunus armeniaca TaxID=36596 RepID=A0A6J5VKL2_PRUAR|nr:unnamed protein product [Prunus armeniaca]
MGNGVARRNHSTVLCVTCMIFKHIMLCPDLVCYERKAIGSALRWVPLRSTWMGLSERLEDARWVGFVGCRILCTLNCWRCGRACIWQQSGQVSASVLRDAQGMINSVLNRGVDLSPLGCLIEDCQELLRAACLVYVVHGFREVNCVADRLAHYPLLAHVPADEVEWWDSPPIWLSDTYRLSKISVEV